MIRTLNQPDNFPIGDTVRNASRQFWLASLGAVVVSREWAQAEAGSAFRTLVKEGAAVESKTIRIVGERLEGSLAMANTFWKHARTTVSTTVKQAADTAVTLVQNSLPKSLPRVTLPAMLTPTAPARTKTAKAKRVGTAKRAAKARAANAVKRGARKFRAATKR